MASISAECRARTTTPVEAPLSLPSIKGTEVVKYNDQSNPAMQCSFLPSEVISALAHPPSIKDNLAPSSSTKTKALSKTANVWNYPKTRSKLKHLTDSTLCSCGAGKDISFLHDIPGASISLDTSGKFDPSAVRVQQQKDAAIKNKIEVCQKLPDTLIPAEYHLTKNRGVLGLEYNPESFTTVAEDHEKHLVMFPSMQPNSRWEVIQLKSTLDAMLKKAGIGENIEVTGETQMHKLLDLIKKEQDIYNIVFHELIRQNTVECVERGELLANLRGRYNDLISKVPIQVKSLHDEVVAQRALDRRLTEELMTFKTTIGVLTSELSDVQQHDSRVSKEARSAQNELKAALEESRKNADLLSEYHALYELQRCRLENQVTTYSQEKEMWSQAAYCLALKVTHERSLTTAKRLHVAEKSWRQLANHFTLMLSEKDTESLTQVQKMVDLWREKTENFAITLAQRDEEMSKMLQSLMQKMEEVKAVFEEKFMNAEKSLILSPDHEQSEGILTCIKEWENDLSSQSETFGGDTMLGLQDNLAGMKRLVLTWGDLCTILFTRHAPEDGSPSQDQAALGVISVEIDKLMTQYTTRLTGDNGVARGVISLMNILESWDSRLKAMIQANKPVPETEWIRFYSLLEDWVVIVQETLEGVGSARREDLPAAGFVQIDPNDIVGEVQKWSANVSSSVDTEDARLMEVVNTLHAGILQWMIQSLLRLAPDHPGNSEEAHTAALLASAPPEDLLKNCQSLSEGLLSFTKYVTLCCSGIVADIVQTKQDNHEDDAEYESDQLKNLTVEANEWSFTATLILQELGIPVENLLSKLNLTASVGGPTRENTMAKSKSEPTQLSIPLSNIQPIGSTDEEQIDLYDEKQFVEEAVFQPIPTSARDQSVDAEERLTQEADEHEQVEWIGHDSNTHYRNLKQDPSTAPQDLVNLEEHIRVATPDAQRAYEAVAALQNLQEQLKEAEVRAQSGEDRAMKAELALAETQERLDDLQHQLEEADKELETWRNMPKPEEPKPSLLQEKVTASSAAVAVTASAKQPEVEVKPPSPASTSPRTHTSKSASKKSTPRSSHSKKK